MESGVFHSTYAADMQIRPKPTQRIRLAIVVAFVLIFPFVANNNQLTIANQILYTAVGAIGLNILTGFTGQISLGQGAFMAVGAYTTGLLMADANVPWLIALPVGCLFAALVGTIFGLPSLRLKGLYLAIATLAAQQIIEWVVIRSPFTRGVEALTIPTPYLFGLQMHRPFNFYWLALIILVLTILFTVNLFRTRVGRAFIAIRDQDIAAEVMGVNIFRYKLLAFAASSFFAGLSGTLLALSRRIVSFDAFTIDTSILFLAIIIIGGLGSISGSIYGSIFMVLLPIMLRSIGRTLGGVIPQMAELIPYIQQGAFGLTIILFLIFEPEGIAKIWRDIKDYFRLWPFSY